MKRHILKLTALMIVVFLLSVTAGAETGWAAGKEVLLRGQLVSEKCMADGRLTDCSLEDSGDSPWVIFTTDKKLYKVELNRAPQWKLDSGFGKQVVLKGILKGNKILVNDAAALEGAKKMSKSCL
ncbi:MAG: hypothetical protein GXP46_13440 [Deferribacteres bacterium]|nr:hypothetical protein [Deferribacteres bacterium]